MDLLAVGGIAFDNLFWVDRLPETHFEAVIEKHGGILWGQSTQCGCSSCETWN